MTFGLWTVDVCMFCEKEEEDEEEKAIIGKCKRQVAWVQALDRLFWYRITYIMNRHSFLSLHSPLPPYLPK